MWFFVDFEKIIHDINPRTKMWGIDNENKRNHIRANTEIFYMETQWEKKPRGEGISL